MLKAVTKKLEIGSEAKKPIISVEEALQFPPQKDPAIDHVKFIDESFMPAIFGFAKLLRSQAELWSGAVRSGEDCSKALLVAHQFIELEAAKLGGRVVELLSGHFAFEISKNPVLRLYVHELKNTFTGATAFFYKANNYVKNGKKEEALQCLSRVAVPIPEFTKDTALDRLEWAANIIRKDPETMILRAGACRSRELELLMTIAQKTTQHPAIGVQTEYEDEIAHLSVPGELTAVLSELVRNAEHALEDNESGRIEVFAKFLGGKLTIYVDDDGPGVPVEFRKKIFQRGFSSREKGTGEGLAMCHEIVAGMLGGRIEVVDSKLGGARFIIEVPITDTN